MVIEKVPFLKNGYSVMKSRFSPGASLEYLAGYYYLQEAAAQIPVEVLSLNETGTETVLDACAAPGGKTTQMAMFTSRPIIALEKQAKRLRSLNNNIERMGCSNIATFQIDALDMGLLKTKFSHILVDAPCSGNFVTDKTWFQRRNVDMFEDRGKLQRIILSKAISCLKPKGALVYSTCSLEPEENEMVVDRILRTENVQLEKINCIGDPGLTNPFGKQLDKDIKLTRRLWPWKTGTQGFFVAKFRKC
jgi:NOL1/NOP2/sun family putative RNA methylase